MPYASLPARRRGRDRDVRRSRRSAGQRILRRRRRVDDGRAARGRRGGLWFALSEACACDRPRARPAGRPRRRHRAALGQWRVRRPLRRARRMTVFLRSGCSPPAGRRHRRTRAMTAAGGCCGRAPFGSRFPGLAPPGRSRCPAGGCRRRRARWRPPGSAWWPPPARRRAAQARLDGRGELVRLTAAGDRRAALLGRAVRRQAAGGRVRRHQVAGRAAAAEHGGGPADRPPSTTCSATRLAGSATSRASRRTWSARRSGASGGSEHAPAPAGQHPPAKEEQAEEGDRDTDEATATPWPVAARSAMPRRRCRARRRLRSAAGPLGAATHGSPVLRRRGRSGRATPSVRGRPCRRRRDGWRGRSARTPAPGRRQARFPVMAGRRNGVPELSCAPVKASQRPPEKLASSLARTPTLAETVQVKSADPLAPVESLTVTTTLYTPTWPGLPAMVPVEARSSARAAGRSPRS